MRGVVVRDVYRNLEQLLFRLSGSVAYSDAHSISKRELASDSANQFSYSSDGQPRSITSMRYISRPVSAQRISRAFVSVNFLASNFPSIICLTYSPCLS